MNKALVRSLALMTAVLGSACALEQSASVQSRLITLEGAAGIAVSKLDRAINDPEYRELGDGVRTIEALARELESVEQDLDASDDQVLVAMALQGRLFESVAQTYDDADADVLRDKTAPARLRAETTYLEALRFACANGLMTHPAAEEVHTALLDISGAQAQDVARVCPD